MKKKKAIDEDTADEYEITHGATDHVVHQIMIQRLRDSDILVQFLSSTT